MGPAWFRWMVSMSKSQNKERRHVCLDLSDPELARDLALLKLQLKLSLLDAGKKSSGFVLP